VSPYIIGDKRGLQSDMSLGPAYG